MQIVSCTEESESLPNILTVVLCMKENMSSSNSAECSCEFQARKDSTRAGQCSHQRLWGIAHKWSQKVLRGIPQANQTLDFTDTPPTQQGPALVLITSFCLQRQLCSHLHVQLMPATQKQQLWGHCVTLDPSLIFIQVFPSAAKHQELIHVTQHWLHMNKMR